MTPRRLGAGLLLALLALVALVVFIRRPGPPLPLPFDTQHPRMQQHPRTQQALRRLGIEPQRVLQGLGWASASAGIHGVDGLVNRRLYRAAFDLP